MTNRLTDLPNIGPKLAEHLEKAGISSPEELREVGAEAAFLRIRTQVDSTACLHELEAPGGGSGGRAQEPAPARAQGGAEGLVPLPPLLRGTLPKKGVRRPEAGAELRGNGFDFSHQPLYNKWQTIVRRTLHAVF